MKVFSKKSSRIIAVACAAALTFGAAVGVSVSFAEEGHKHTFSDSWSKDSKNHYHLSTCGDDIITGAEAHDFDNDGKCRVCGFAASQPAHTHTYEDKWTYDEINHYHKATCHDVARDTAAHTFVNGVCKCGYPQPAVGHTHTYESSWNYDGVYHWHESKCGHDIIKDMSAHKVTGGVCECGYSNVTGDFSITANAYEEGLYAEWNANSVSGASVSYQLKGTSSWTPVDSQLIRMTGEHTARVDAVGLKAGKYNLKVTASGATATASDIEVTEYDREGYAHFGTNTGVGAYNNDGTPKNNAQIIYVTEQTKNTVSVKWGSKTYTGIANILSNSSKCPDPLIVRVIGRVAAATWNEISYKPYQDGSGHVTPAIVSENTKGTGGKQLELKAYTQADLIKGGFNSLNETKYDELLGLSSKLKYDGKEFDSCWNDCSISEAENVTVEGIGTDAELFQWGMTWVKCKSIEVRNLTFDDYTEDACSFEGNEAKTSADEFTYKRFWVHHNVFNEGKNYWNICNEQDKGEGDGATDFKKLSYVTVSYNHYYKNHKTGLIGGGSDHMTANVTFHHNYYKDCKSRLPLARQANMHMYNNYYHGTTGENMSLRASAVALVEYCYFDNANKAVTTGDSTGVGLVWNCTFKGKSLTKTAQVVEITTRDANNGVTNSSNANSFGGINYYLNPSRFYFTTDAAIKANPYFVATADIPAQIPLLAGVHKN